MTAIDEKHAARMRDRAEEVLALYDRVDAEYAARVDVVLEREAKLVSKLEAASAMGDLKVEAESCRKLAAAFKAAMLSGPATRYLERAGDCSDRLRRRTWIENQKAGRHNGGSKR